MNSICRKPSTGTGAGLFSALQLAGLVMLLPGQPALAGTAYGTLSNFDVVNDTGEDCHGFEIELEDVSSGQISYTFGGSYIRYGNPTVAEKTVNGKIVTVVRYASAYSNGAWEQSTPQFPPTSAFTPNGHACWTGGMGGDYATSGCEHFGVGVSGNPAKTTYRWLVADPANVGQLKPRDPPVAIPAPVWNVVPNAAGGVEVQAALPEVEPPPAQCSLFGDAQWVKIYKTESTEPAVLENLLTGNIAVPQGSDEIEVEWQFLQAAPTCDENGNPVIAENEFVLGGPVGEGNASVTRRYEFYKYAGYVSGVEDSKEAFPLCDSSPYLDPTPIDPNDPNDPATTCQTVLPEHNGDLGDYVGAQMAAVNLLADQPPPPPPPLALNFDAVLPVGEVGLAYGSSAVSASGGTPPYRFAGVNLPAGLGVDAGSGALAGTPAATYSASITVQVTDQANQTASDASALQIVAHVGVASTSLKSGARNKSYSATLAAGGGKSPYAWLLAGGSLPAGLGLNGSTGKISGVPTVRGTFYPVFQVADSLGGTAQKTLKLVIK
ncbi:MAG TPA: Ig domain-containing protein [Methylococcaceae bacterium]|nr:Ig domain-containing protein [Methylococcaceae bacterium]